MPTDAAPLQNLAQLIRQHEAELQRLRQQYEARQTQLADLARRKEALQTQLRQVEAEIQAVGQDEISSPAPAPRTALPRTPAASTLPTNALRPGSLPELLVALVRQAGRPMTAKDLTAEVTRRKFPTTSRNLAKTIQTRVDALVQRGILRRATGQPGVVPVEAPEAGKPTATKVTPGHGANARQGATGKAPTSGTSSGKIDKRSLRDVLTDLLANSPRPLTARELAEQALESGYQTKSKEFINVIWVALGKLENIEKVDGQGWQLKKQKANR